MSVIDWIGLVVVGGIVLALLLPIVAGIIDSLAGTEILPWLQRFPQAFKRR